MYINIYIYIYIYMYVYIYIYDYHNYWFLVQSVIYIALLFIEHC